MVHWIRLHASNAGGQGAIPDQETRSHMPQLRVYMQQLKILHTPTKKDPVCLSEDQRSHVLQLRPSAAK